MWKSRCLLLRVPVIGRSAGNSTAKPGHLSNHVRRFVSRKTRHRSLRPVEEVEGSSRGLQGLLKPFTFAVGVTGLSFTGAAIWQYEGFRHLARQQQRGTTRTWNYGFYGKAGDLRNRLNAWWNQLYPAEKLVCGIIGANAVIFLAWRLPGLSTFMINYFMASPMAKATAWPMLLSSFSHYSFLHLFINMYVLWSFAPIAAAKFGKEHFLATYVSAGVVSSFVSYAYKLARASTVPSLGASGAIMALIGIVGSCYPDTRLSVAFVSNIYPHSFSAESGMKGLIIFDTLGVLFGWRFFDHAGHLGGMLFGIWYSKYGHKVARKHRDAVVQYWHKLRGKPSK